MNLSDQISKHFRLSPPQKTALAKMRVQTVLDLLYHFPTRYTSTAEAVHVTSLTQGMKATIFGTISNLKTGKTFKSQMSMASARLTDETGTIELVWFNQPYIAKMIPDGSYVRVEGAVSERRKKKIENKAEVLEKTESSDVAKNEGSISKENQRPQLYLSNPEIEVIKEVPLAVGESLFKNTTGQQAEFAHTLYPIYPESRGITSNWIYHAIKKVLAKLAQPQGELEMAPDPLPKEILDAYNLPSQKTAFIWIHNPLNEADARAARKRFAFEEIFFIQLYKQKKRLEYASHAAFIIDPDKNANLAGRSPTNGRTLENFISRFPFPLSGAQKRAIDDIMLDMKSGAPMERLLEGDVGSGKTAVAATSAFAVVTSKPSVSLIKKNAEKEAKMQAEKMHMQMEASTTTAYKTGFNVNLPPKIKLGDGKLQVAYMCPTEILATQHFESFIKYFEYLGIAVALMTGSGCRKFPSKVNPKGWTDISRAQLLKWVASGEIPIVIGTHALLQKTVVFKNLGLVIIDEQHRFGTAQRSSLVRKDQIAPHLLSMTATPIPRTLALTMYGDLDLSLLDEMPVGRKPVVTKIVVEHDRDDAYSHIRTLLEEGRQAYVICPRIDAPDPDKETALNAKSVIEEAKRLKKDIFKESKWQIGIMHGKMKSDDKERVMRDFSEGKINILCSTSVIEVGVNVPNATVMIIEGSERFGLSQLHQLRGRIMRSSHVPYCYVFTSTKNTSGNGSNASSNSATEETLKRLKAFTSAKNGFELAEYDLALRGSGELYNGKQWGVSDIAMDALRNLKMVETARREAGRILAQDPALTNHPLLKEQISHPDFEKLHFE